MGPGFTKIKVWDYGEFVLTYCDLVPRNCIHGAVEGGSTVLFVGSISCKRDCDADHGFLLDFLAIEDSVVTRFGTYHPLLSSVFAARFLPVGTWVLFRKVVYP